MLHFLNFLHLALCINDIQRRDPALDPALDAALTANKANFLPLLPTLLLDVTRLLLTGTRLFALEFSRELQQEKAPVFHKQAL